MASRAIRIGGILFVPALWCALKYILHLPDRYLPDPLRVLRSGLDVEPGIFVHTAYTVSRFITGFVFGTTLGIALALLMHRSDRLNMFLMPSIQTSRSIPAIALVPFFILWFGFSEPGRYLLVLTGTAFNVSITALEILKNIPERHAVMFRSFGLRSSAFPLRYGVPFIFENILPTLRFSLSSSIGLIVASEMLGSQIGLGYLIQTSRATFSLDLLFLSVILLGAISAMADGGLVRLWRTALFWKKS